MTDKTFSASRLFAAALLAVAATGCSTVMSGENVGRSFDECLQDGGSPSAKLIFCNIAIHSGEYRGKDLADLHFMKGIHFQDSNQHGKAIGAFTDALRINPADAEAHYYRGWSRQALGDRAQAQADFDAALRYERNRDFAQAASANREAMNHERRARAEALERERNRPVALVYNGMWCPRVQKDSVFYPANEILIDVVVTDQDGNYRKTALPGRGKVYKNIKAGATRKASVELWRGPSEPLMVQIVMWEYDDGGPLVENLTEIAVDFALTRGTRTMSKYAVKKGVHVAAAKGGRYAANQAIEQLDLTGQLSKSISSLPKALVGANNDLVGAIGVTNVSADAYDRLGNEHGFNYHFYTRHRGGGADCRVYFAFR